MSLSRSRRNRPTPSWTWTTWKTFYVRVDANELKAEDGKAIRALVQSYIHLTQLLQDKNTSLSRLRKMLFGVKTEKTLAVVGSTTDAQTPSSPEADTVTDPATVYRLVPGSQQRSHGASQP